MQDKVSKVNTNNNFGVTQFERCSRQEGTNSQSSYLSHNNSQWKRIEPVSGVLETGWNITVVLQVYVQRLNHKQYRKEQHIRRHCKDHLQDIPHRR